MAHTSRVGVPSDTVYDTFSSPITTWPSQRRTDTIIGPVGIMYVQTFVENVDNGRLWIKTHSFLCLHEVQSQLLRFLQNVVR